MLNGKFGGVVAATTEPIASAERLEVFMIAVQVGTLRESYYLSRQQELRRRRETEG